MGGSAQLLKPHRMHRIPQTDRRGGVPVECGGLPGVSWFQTLMDPFFFF